MNKTENAVIKYQIDLEKYKNGQANAIIELLDNANSEIAKYIKRTSGVYTKARYKEIAKKLKEMSAALKSNVESGLDVDGVIDYELKKQSKILDTLKNDIMKVKNVGEVNFLYPSVEQIKTSALFTPITKDGYGMTWESYLNGIENGFYNTWDVGVRTGYLTGQTTQQIVKNVIGGVSKIDKLANPGSITSLRNSVYANTRTALQALANETQRKVYEENEQYFAKNNRYEYLATLDSRTCLVCGALDGKTFDNLNDDKFQIPKHRGCRCMIIPHFEIEGDTRASKNGQVDSKLTFNDWLKEQDEKTQKEVLGNTRFELFKKGEKIEQFVDNGKILTLDELKKKLEDKKLSENFENIYGNAKTVKEAEEELKHFCEIVTLPKNADLETVNTVTKRLEYLTSKYPTKKLDYITFKKMSNNIGASAAFNQLNVNSNIKAYNKKTLQPNEWQEFVGSNLDKLKKWKKDMEVKLKSASDNFAKSWAQKAIEKYDKQIKQWIEYKNYLRNNVSYIGAETESVISHEYGHILADQKIGQINGYKANKNYEVSIDNELYKKCKMCENVFKQAKKNKDIYKISYYGASNVKEFFAESFAIYSMGKEKLPQYIVEMIEEIIK